MSTLQDEIIQSMHVQPQIDPNVEITRSVDFLKAYLRAHPFLHTLVLGISGGQDSTLAGKLCQLAVEDLRKETGDMRYRFLAVRLPYGIQADEQDAADAVTWIEPDETFRVDIKPSVDASVASLVDAGVALSDFNIGNTKARMRMIVQYSLAGERRGVVVGTDHPAERVTGFFTKFGDGGSDVLPLFRLNKRQGRQLLKALNAPPHLIMKVPIADLEDEKPGQSDEEALGVTYDDIDDYLEGKQISDKAAQTIERWYTQSMHKRHMPITMFDHFWETEH